jgi:hypothetical protein
MDYKAGLKLRADLQKKASIKSHQNVAPYKKRDIDFLKNELGT